mmetsp:Transcript_46005/g.67886  ORF Transcript_46005/g.67886 Transcript_46005/m.67886 type:complete len:103 (+) Transcript_46005:1099-1407(+)
MLKIIGPLAWRMIASSFLLAFMSNPLIYIFVRVCLLLEATGICYASWMFACYHKLIDGYEPNEFYLEGAEKYGAEPVTKRVKHINLTVTVIKYTFSMIFLVF